MPWQEGIFPVTILALAGEQTGEPTGQEGSDPNTVLEGGEEEEVIPEETENTDQTEVSAQEETQEGEATPFSVPGNGEVLDDKQEDGTK